MTNSLQDNRILAIIQLKAYTEDNFNLAEIVQFFFERVGNLMEKGAKCW